MKKLIILFILLVISVSIFAQDSIFPKEFKTKKVKITDKVTTVNALLETLSKDSNIKFLPGETYDWRVAERDIIIVPFEEIQLKALLDSVAFCTKLVWIKKDDNTYILTYNENTDLFIRNLNNQAEENLAKKRKEAIDKFFDENTTENLDKLKEDDPFNYLLDVTGLKTTTVGAINNIPGLKEALSNGTQITIKGSDLSEKAVNYINTSSSIINDLMEDRFQKMSNGKEKRKEKEAVNKIKNTLPKDLSRVSIEVNNSNNPMSNIMLGNATILIDGKPVGFIPIIDSSSPLAKKIGNVLVNMYEDPNITPKDAFNSLGGFDLFKDLNKDLNGDLYDENKINIPDGIVFDEEITLEDTPKSRLNAFELLSKASGYSIVSDNYTNILDLFSGKNIRKTGTLKEIVSDINDAYGLTMYMENNVMIFYSIKWFEEIQKLMPKAYYEKWGKQYSEDGFLSHENLYEMVNFTKDQLSFGFMKSPELTKLTMSIIPNYDVIKFLSKLDENTLKELESENGLKLSNLISSVSEELTKNSKFKFLSNNKESIVKLKIEKTDTCETINVIGQTMEKSETVSIKLEKYSPFAIKNMEIK